MDRWFMEYESNLPQAPEPEIVSEALWFIWKERNDAVFRAKRPDPQGVVADMLAMKENFKDQIPLQKRDTSTAKDISLKWKPPDLGWVKINVDRAFKAGTNDGSVAGVCRDAHGVLPGGLTPISFPRGNPGNL
ncbi:hypothetical protein ACJRO7_021657 [Eucalyptus globulus]|uniref:Uncharacterized protein n=1 Tax=Eucalyptus globulus TaxID=34317 RepID=A0ABD3KQE5_EUCGL